MPPISHAHRAAAIEALIPPPPADVKILRNAFSTFVSKQWQSYVPTVLADFAQSLSEAQSAKARFIAEMYARACYSMLLVSSSGPGMLRLLLRAAALLPRDRAVTIQLGSTFLKSLGWLLPKTVHRQLLLTSELMGRLDVVLDEAAPSGESAVLRISSLITRSTPTTLPSSHQSIARLAEAARRNESAWQCEYWETVLRPAVRDYCLAEAFAVAHAPDSTCMGHRWAGVDAALKGMWYVVAPYMGLQVSLCRFKQSEWNREQQWMADTSLLMQMIDDWVDQDQDRGTRLTPVIAGDWKPETVYGLYCTTVQNLSTMLRENRLHNSVLQKLFVDLYTDYLYTALEAMRTGIAA